VKRAIQGIALVFLGELLAFSAQTLPIALPRLAGEVLILPGLALLIYNIFESADFVSVLAGAFGGFLGAWFIESLMMSGAIYKYPALARLEWAALGFGVLGNLALAFRTGDSE